MANTIICNPNENHDSTQILYTSQSINSNTDGSQLEIDDSNLNVT